MIMGTEIFKIDAPWAEELTKTRVSFLMNPTVILHVCGICSVGTRREWFRVHTGDGLESGAGRWSDSWDLS